MQAHTLKTATTTYNATCHLGLALVGLFSHLSASLDIVLLCSSRDERGIILVILIRYTSRSTWWRSYFSMASSSNAKKSISLGAAIVKLRRRKLASSLSAIVPFFCRHVPATFSSAHLVRDP